MFKVGYSKKEVKNIKDDYEQRLNIQRRDIEFLKKDNEALRNSLFKMSCELNNSSKQ